MSATKAIGQKLIPSSVFDLLKYRWREADGGSAFEFVFRDLPDSEDRRAYPSYYFIRAGQKIETDADTFSHAEAVALIESGAFGSSMARINDDASVVINEHAAHAMQDLCQEIYGAWQKYQRRLHEIEQTCPALT